MADDKNLLEMLFGGAAREAGEDISLRKKYNKKVMEMQSKGQTPPSFEEFKQQQQQQGNGG